MIQKLYIRNFKPLKEVELSLGRLNLLAGINGMGKSSLIQVLLLLKQSLPRLEQGTLLLNNEEFAALGKGRDVFYQYSKEPYIEFELTNDKGFSKYWKFNYQAEREYLEGEKQYDLRELSAQFNLFSDNFQYLNAERIGPRQFHLSSSSYIETLKQIGSKGEYAVH